MSRRRFLWGAAAACAIAGRPAWGQSTATSPSGGAAQPGGAFDPVVARIVDLSKDAQGRAHVARATLILISNSFMFDGMGGTLPISKAEAGALLAALGKRDFAGLSQGGLLIGGQKFLVFRAGQDAPGILALRGGELVTVQAAGDQVVIATSADGMVHGRAVEAVYKYLLRYPRLR